MKTCTKCAVTKPLDEFYRGKPHPWCKDCRRTASKAHYHANREDYLAKGLAYRKANPEKMRELYRAHYLRDPEAKRLRNIEWEQRNIERRAEKWREWYEAGGKELQVQINRRRRAILRGLPHEKYTLPEVIERDGDICWLCTEPIDFTLVNTKMSWTFEHFIPVKAGMQLLDSLGLSHPGDVLANVGVAHNACNAGKGNRYTETDVGRYLENLERHAA